MNVLALDSACSACSAAVLRDGAVMAERFRPMVRGHVEALMPLVLETLAEAGTGFDRLDLLAVTVGPGSFTGLRAGLAAARGIALARALPLVGITTLEAVAHAARGPAAGDAIVVAIETRRADLYVQRFAADGTADGEAAALLPDEAAALVPPEGALLAGDGAHRLAAAAGGRRVRIMAGPGLPRAGDVAVLGLQRAGGRGALPPVAPFYLHPPEARLPGAARAVRA